MILKTWSGSYIDTKKYPRSIWWKWAMGWTRYAFRRTFGKWRKDENLPPCKRKDEES